MFQTCLNNAFVRSEVDRTVLHTWQLSFLNASAFDDVQQKLSPVPTPFEALFVVRI